MIMNKKSDKKWKSSYTWVLILNTLYIVIFYIIMQIYA